MILLALAAWSSSAFASADPSRPNVVFMFPDYWRGDWMPESKGANDDGAPIPLQMPFLTSLMNEGTWFTNAYSAAPVCAPSRATIVTGREYDSAGTPCNFCGNVPTNISNLFQALSKSGNYHTATTGKDDLTKTTQPGPNGDTNAVALGFKDWIRFSGKDDVISTQTPHEPYGFWLDNQTVSLENGTEMSAWGPHRACLRKGPSDPLCDSTSYNDFVYEDDFTTRNALELLRRRPTDKPFALWISWPGPHPPFSVTTNQTKVVAGRTFPGPVDYKNSGSHRSASITCVPTGEPATSKSNRCDYAAEMERLDEAMAAVMGEVHRQRVADNTVFIFASDHGEMLLDHGVVGKTKPFQGSSHVPLVFRAPGLGIRQNATVRAPATVMDIAATILDYAGVDVPEGMTSRSLRPVLEGSSPSVRPFVSSGLQSTPFGASGDDAERDWNTDAVTSEYSGANGGYNWRMVVQAENATATNLNALRENGSPSPIWKFICCRGSCPGAATTVPNKPDKNGWVQLLFDVAADPFEMSDVLQDHPDVVAQLKPLLPREYKCGQPTLV